MTQKIPRLRMFAGPNGSGKSTIKSVISPHLLGIYVDPDQIEREWRENQFFSLSPYQFDTTKTELVNFFSNSSLLQSVGYINCIEKLEYCDQKISLQSFRVDSYVAAVTADFIRHKFLEGERSFSFETVMSFPDKIELLRKAQKGQYRTYLYYVATEDPEINISRVRNRVQMGGHSVPEDKIISRYYRSLDLLMEAVQVTNRSYIFDNSGHEHVWIAEIADGRQLEMKTNLMPLWFKSSLWDKFAATAT